MHDHINSAAPCLVIIFGNPPLQQHRVVKAPANQLICATTFIWSLMNLICLLGSPRKSSLLFRAVGLLPRLPLQHVLLFRSDITIVVALPCRLTAPFGSDRVFVYGLAHRSSHGKTSVSSFSSFFSCSSEASPVVPSCSSCLCTFVLISSIIPSSFHPLLLPPTTAAFQVPSRHWAARRIVFQSAGLALARSRQRHNIIAAANSRNITSSQHHIIKWSHRRAIAPQRKATSLCHNIAP